MSQPSLSAADQARVAELKEELTFESVLLESLNDFKEDQPAIATTIKNRIQAINRELKQFTLTQTTALTSQASSSSNRSIRPSSSADMDISGRFPSESQFNEQRESMGSLSSAASTPSSGASMAESQNPQSRVNLPSRKRSHSKHLDAGLLPFEENKSRRTSPSPLMTGITTPSGSSGDDEAAYKFYNDVATYEKQKQMEDRFKQQKHDAEYARNLDRDSTGFSWSSQSAQNSGPSAFDRMSGSHPSVSSNGQVGHYSSTPASAERPLDESNATRRTLPSTFSKSGSASSVSMKSEPQSSFGNTFNPNFNFSNTGFGGITGHSQNGNSAKMESDPSVNMPGAWVDLMDSDSEIEIIEPSQFQPNQRQRSNQGIRNGHTRMNEPLYSPDYMNAGNAATLQANNFAGQRSGLHQAIYGNHPQPPWMMTPPAMNGMNQMAPSNMVNYQYNPGPNNLAYPNFQATPNVPSYSSLPSYHTGSMHNAGLGYTMNNTPVYPGSSQQGMASNDVGSLSEIIRRSNGRTNDEMMKYFNSGNNLREDVDYIVNDPRKTAQQIQELLQNIKTEVEIPLEDREGTPDGLKYPLYEHQKIALSWLKSMEEGSNKGGILADDMGLGKTISSLALILSRPSTDRSCKTTLIVGPVALVRQWEREIRMKTKASIRYRLSTHMAHGSKKLGFDELKNFDVVLTTYGTLGAELGRIEKREQENLEKKIEADGKEMTKSFPFLGPRSKFYRIILDEAQYIKNRNTKAARAACRLKAQTRFCLTGTPMMNGVGELYSLIRFLQIKPYNSWPAFSQQFGCLSKGQASQGRVNEGSVKKAMPKLQAVLKAILLRRTKTSLIDGKPIINLPPKIEEVQHVVFNNDEDAFYKSLESKTQIQFNKYKKAGTIGKNYSNVLVLLLRLRQCCCHPHLIHDLEEEAPGGELDADAVIELAKGLSPAVVSRLLAAESFECPICYDAVPNPSIIIPCGHDTCSECLAKISEQAVQGNIRDGNEGVNNATCPSCRGMIDVTKVIDYKAFKNVHMPANLPEGEKIVSDDDSDDDSSDDSDTDTLPDDVDDEGNLDGFVVADDVVSEYDAEEGDDEDEEVVVKPKEKKKMNKEKKRKDKKGKGKQKDTKIHLSIAMMKKEASHSAEGRKKYMRYLRKNWQPSAKVDKCVELLENFHNEGEKTIIFSQFVSLLDLLQVPIEQKGWKCERYDGGMNSQRRNDAIVRFTEDPACKIMLISLKAGNAGLNLVAASRVIILDPFWNPFIEMQAIDRAYRIGQMKSVQVHRILVEGTVEDRILTLQRQKKELVDAALDEGAMRSLGRLDVGQLGFLFGV